MGESPAAGGAACGAGDRLSVLRWPIVAQPRFGLASVVEPLGGVAFQDALYLHRRKRFVGDDSQPP